MTRLPTKHIFYGVWQSYWTEYETCHYCGGDLRYPENRIEHKEFNVHEYHAVMFDDDNIVYVEDWTNGRLVATPRSEVYDTKEAAEAGIERRKAND